MPSNRIFHECWFESPNLFIYGGMDKNNLNYNDLYCLNVHNFVWKKFIFFEGPFNRIHSAFA